jgi:hypothetical protein
MNFNVRSSNVFLMTRTYINQLYISMQLSVKEWDSETPMNFFNVRSSNVFWMTRHQLYISSASELANSIFARSRRAECNDPQGKEKIILRESAETGDDSGDMLLHRINTSLC